VVRVAAREAEADKDGDNKLSADGVVLLKHKQEFVFLNLNNTTPSARNEDLRIFLERAATLLN
jgi:hypothetical protein